MTPIEEIEHDLDWREAEMAVLRLMLTDNGLPERTKRVLFRSAWSMLYAHFEGFCKFTLTVFYDTVGSKGSVCSDLATNTQVFALSGELKTLRNLPPAELIERIQNFETEVLAKAPKFPEVDTESNLWPSVLERLISDADLQLDSLSQNARTISTLVSRRNKIAHGERDIIPDFDYYLKFEDAVKNVMYELAIAVDKKLSSYLAG